jgi:hypothetical protein
MAHLNIYFKFLLSNIILDINYISIIFQLNFVRNIFFSSFYNVWASIEKQVMGNANLGKKGDQVENGKKIKTYCTQIVTQSHEIYRNVQTPRLSR